MSSSGSSGRHVGNGILSRVFCSIRPFSWRVTGKVSAEVVLVDIAGESISEEIVSQVFLFLDCSTGLVLRVTFLETSLLLDIAVKAEHPDFWWAVISYLDQLSRAHFPLDLFPNEVTTFNCFSFDSISLFFRKLNLSSVRCPLSACSSVPAR